MSIGVKMKLNGVKILNKGRVNVHFNKTKNNVSYKRIDTYLDGLLTGKRLFSWWNFTLIWSK